MHRPHIVILLFLLLISCASAAIPPHASNVSGAFVNGKIVTLTYTFGYNCTPGIEEVYPNLKNVSSIKNLTDCTIYQQNGNLYGTLPIWGITPAFSGASTFGLDLNSSKLHYQYPIYKGNTIYTACGIGSTPASCIYAPQYTYSLKAYLFEQLMGIYNGLVPYNLTGPKIPQGILPFQPVDYILLNDYSNSTTPWRLVSVRVFDPNIFPDATTGKCAQIAPSNLTNATGNCLTSFAALQRAISTKNSYIPVINSNNPLWKIVGNTTNQIEIGYSNASINGVSTLFYPNTNEYLFFTIKTGNPYSHGSIPESVNNMFVYIIGTVVAILFLINVGWFVSRARLKKG